MAPHRFEHRGLVYEVTFEETPEGWIGRIVGEDGATVHVIAFPTGIGFDPGDVRGSLIAGCEAVIAQRPAAPPVRH